MNKHLIAAAVAAAVAVPAAAQVTITGNMDIGQTEIKTSESNSANNLGRTVQRKNSALLGNGGNAPYSSSMLKFDAKEDLGGGLTAFATHEVNLNNTGTGEAQGGSFGASRQSFVGVSGGFGALTIGYQYAHEHGVLNGAGTSGTNNSIGTLQSGTSGLGKVTRHDMIQWASPTFGGVQLIGQIGEQKSESSSTQFPNGRRDAAASDFTSLGLNYASGPLVLRAGFSQQELDSAEDNQPASAAGTNAVNIDIRTLGAYDRRIGTFAAGTAAGGNFDASVDRESFYVGANYNLGTVKLFANFADRDADLTSRFNGVRQADVKDNVRSYDVGVQFAMGSTMLFGSVGNGEFKRSLGGVEDFQEDIDAYQIGVYHALSKRTGLYALTGQNKFKETTSAQVNRETAKVTQTSLGVRHSF